MKKSTRRRFLQAAAVGATVPLLADDAQAGEPVSADLSLLAIVRQRFKHLTDDQLKAVQRGLQTGIAAGEILKRVRLTPLDEPSAVFVADVAE